MGHSWVTHVRTALVVALVAGSGGLVVAGAQADTAPPAGTPATVSADRLPTWQINGVVWGQAIAKGVVFAGGKFTKARPPGVSAGGAGEVTAQNFVAYDITTGNRVASFSHSVNGQILAVAAAPDESRVYIAGDFTSVDGQSRGRIAALDSTTGALVSDFKPSLNGQVSALAVSGSTVYAGGSFSKAGSATRTRLAAFDRADGALVSNWAPTADGNKVQALALSPDGTRVIVGGRFSTLSGVSAKGMGSVSTAPGAAILPWAANRKIVNAGDSCAINSLVSDDRLIYGSGFAFGCGNFEGTFGADPNTGAIVFVNDCHGDTYDTFPLGQVLYSVSHAHDCRWVNSFPESNPRSTNMRHALAQTTYGVGTNRGPDNYGWNYSGLPASDMLQWFPELANGSFTGQTQAAWTITGNDDYIVLGGEFPSVNGVRQQGLVRFARPGLAPNNVGPVRGSGAPNPTATKQGAASAKITWRSAYDMDNKSLSYDVYRSGTADPVGTVTGNSNFWTTPDLSFTDQGIPSGTYTYTVRARDAFGNSVGYPATSSISSSGGGNTPPQAAFSADPDDLSVHFDGSGSNDPDGSIVDYSWNFGDGSPAGSGESVDHTYDDPGTYTVTLTVRDNGGAQDIETRNVSVTAGGDPDPTTVAADAFERTVASGWGSADQGGAWTTSGSASGYSVGGGVGTFAMQTAGAGPSAMLGGVSSDDADTVVTLSSQKLATVGIYITMVGRSVGSEAYHATLGLKSNGTATLKITKAGGTSATIVGSTTVPGFTYAAGDRIGFRFQTAGTSPTTVRARVWNASGPEPTTWQAAGSDSTASLQTAGSVGLMGYLSGSSTNAPSPVTFDDFSVTDAN